MKALMKPYELHVTPVTKTSLEKSQPCHQTLAKGGRKNGSTREADPGGARENPAPQNVLLWASSVAT